MKCPHCKNEITRDDLKGTPEEDLKKIRAMVSGMISKRKLTPEQSKAMNEKRWHKDE